MQNFTHTCWIDELYGCFTFIIHKWSAASMVICRILWIWAQQLAHNINSSSSMIKYGYDKFQRTTCRLFLNVNRTYCDNVRRVFFLYSISFHPHWSCRSISRRQDLSAVVKFLWSLNCCTYWGPNKGTYTLPPPCMTLPTLPIKQGYLLVWTRIQCCVWR